jgi:predicted GNAT family acetyltransferase
MELGLPSRSLDNKQLLLLRHLQILEVLAEAVEDHLQLLVEVQLPEEVVEETLPLLVEVVANLLLKCPTII